MFCYEWPLPNTRVRMAKQWAALAWACAGHLRGAAGVSGGGATARLRGGGVHLQSISCLAWQQCIFHGRVTLYVCLSYHVSSKQATKITRFKITRFCGMKKPPLNNKVTNFANTVKMRANPGAGRRIVVSLDSDIYDRRNQFASPYQYELHAARADAWMNPNPCHKTRDPAIKY